MVPSISPAPLSPRLEEKIKPHPARFPVELPEFFIKFLTGEGDPVLDPFAGSCTTSEATERLNGKWIGFEPVAEYLDGARFRFERADLPRRSAAEAAGSEPEQASSPANVNNSR